MKSATEKTQKNVTRIPQRMTQKRTERTELRRVDPVIHKYEMFPEFPHTAARPTFQCGNHSIAGGKQADLFRRFNELVRLNQRTELHHIRTGNGTAFRRVHQVADRVTQIIRLAGPDEMNPQQRHQNPEHGTDGDSITEPVPVRFLENMKPAKEKHDAIPLFFRIRPGALPRIHPDVLPRVDDRINNTSETVQKQTEQRNRKENKMIDAEKTRLEAESEAEHA